MRDALSHDYQIAKLLIFMKFKVSPHPPPQSEATPGIQSPQSPSHAALTTSMNYRSQLQLGPQRTFATLLRLLMLVTRRP